MNEDVKIERRAVLDPYQMIQQIFISSVFFGKYIFFFNSENPIFVNQKILLNLGVNCKTSV